MEISLDYPIKPTPRYGYGKPPHVKLYELIDRNRASYEEYLHSFLQFKYDFTKILRFPSEDAPNEPAWENMWIPASDSVALYSLIRLHKPKKYFEIGSGNSTKFARKAIVDGNLETEIISFDPQPRAEIDSLCNSVIRIPIEDVELSIFEQLEHGDFLFVDNSHRIFMNSDVAVVFLDILPTLKTGVFIEFHDILLPFDYPPVWVDRYYSEQYVLAAYLLAEGNKFDVILPNAFIGVDTELSKITTSLWDCLNIDQRIARHGSSFWIRITGQDR